MPDCQEGSGGVAGAEEAATSARTGGGADVAFAESCGAESNEHCIFSGKLRCLCTRYAICLCTRHLELT
eukprot:1723025-Rhodomonas_salina.1